MKLTRRQLGLYGLAITSIGVTASASFTIPPDLHANDILSYAKVDLGLTQSFREQIDTRFWQHSDAGRASLRFAVQTANTRLKLFKTVNRIWDFGRADEPLAIQPIGSSDARLQVFDRAVAAEQEGRRYNALWHGNEPLPLRLSLSQTLVDYARWAKEIERAAAMRKIALSELQEPELEKLISNIQGNIEMTLPKRHYADVAPERLIADYGLVQAGFVLASRRLSTLDKDEASRS